MTHTLGADGRALDEIVEACVTPEMAVHLTTDSRAAVRSIHRVFRGRKMDLTLVMGRVGGGHAVDLVASGIVRKVIAGSFGAVSPSYTGPLPQVDRTYRSGEVEFEFWSFLTLTQRLIAGAQGQPFALTHSLAGSDMAAFNQDAVSTVTSPWTDEPAVMVRALRPDLAFLHAPLADRQGNTVVPPPNEEGAWGALAAVQGAIVTAERIVDQAELRPYAHLVALPASRVVALCEAAFGAHPGAFGSHLVPTSRSYVADDEFYDAYVAAARATDRSRLDAWLAEWVLESPHEGYVARLGEHRLDRLIAAQSEPAQVAALGKARPPDDGEGLAESRAATPNEVIMVLAWRCVQEKVRHRSGAVLLVGVGLSEVAATATFESLSGSKTPVTLAMGHGYVGFQLDASGLRPDARSSAAVTDAVGVYETLLGGPDRPGIAVLGTAQVDRFGNLNSTLVDGHLLTGSGGSNDASSVCDTIVVTRFARLRGEVDYVTCAGINVSAVVTEQCVLTKGPDGTLRLELYLPAEGQRDEQTLEALIAQCPWPLQISPSAHQVAPPTAEELAVVRRLAPRRYDERGAKKI